MIKKVGKFILSLLVILGVFTVGRNLIGFLTIDDAYRQSRLMVEDLEKEEQIDHLFVGASHVFCGIVPQIMDENLGGRSFCMASSEQPMNLSLFLIQKAVEQYHTKHIYLELSFSNAEKWHIGNWLARYYYVTDYLPFSPQKISFLANLTDVNSYVNSFMPEHRSYSTLFDPKEVNDILSRKLAGDDPSVPQTNSYIYEGRGAVISEEALDSHGIFDEYDLPSLNSEDINKAWKSELMKIVSYCQENQVELTLFEAPVSDFLLSLWPDYDAFHSYVAGVAAENGLPFYDFNLAKTEYWPYDPALFWEKAHLNKVGRERFSDLFCDVLTGRLLPEQVFYAKVSDRAESYKPCILGIYYRDKKHSDPTRTERQARIISNQPEKITCELFCLTEDGQREIISTEMDDITLNPYETRDYHIEYRDRESGAVLGETILKPVTAEK